MGIRNPIGVGMSNHHICAESANGSMWKSDVANDGVKFYKISHGNPYQYVKGAARNSGRKDRLEEICTQIPQGIHVIQKAPIARMR